MTYLLEAETGWEWFERSAIVSFLVVFAMNLLIIGFRERRNRALQVEIREAKQETADLNAEIAHKEGLLQAAVRDLGFDPEGWVLEEPSETED